jgi:hypothetical protein
VPPSADVHPVGTPGIVAGGIEVEREANSARVESVDPAHGTVVVSEPGIPVIVCRIGPSVRHRDDIRAGDEVRATIKEVLTVYVAPPTERPYAPARGLYPDARVLIVDPSYRLLTVLYQSGATDTFKVGLHTQMRGVVPGDSVAIRPVQVVYLRLRRHSNRENRSRSSPSAPAVR